jgi:hypothetical protein
MNSLIIGLITVFIIIISNYESLKINKNQDYLISNLYLDPNIQNLLNILYKEDNIFQTANINLLDNTIYILSQCVKTGEPDKSNFIYCKNLKIYSSKNLTNLI